MIQKKTWSEFKESGLLWWINRMLHLFGWAIVIEMDANGEINEVYPSHCSFRGFSDDVEDRGFKNLTKHMSDNLDRIKNDLDG